MTHSLPMLAPEPRWWTRLLVVLALACAGLLQACGGGGTSLAGVGTGGTGSATGSVSGFGSVLVDGIEYDDSSASVRQDDGSGSLANAELKLGQRVHLVFDAGNKAQTVTLLPQLAGPAGSAVDASGWFEVMGQWVKLVPAAGDATQSVPTVLDGYASAGAIASGDEVEVHGAWAFDASRASYVLVASRVEKLAVAADPVLYSGVLVSVSGNRVRLNANGGTQLLSSSLPAGTAAGQLVRAWAARASFALDPVPVARLVLASLGSRDLAGQAKVLLSGLASHYDGLNRTVEVQGTKVQLAANLQVDEGALQRGEFVSLTLSGSGASVVATALSLRSSGGGPDLGRTVEVAGVTSGIDWTPAVVRFSLRGVPISAAQGVIANGCRLTAANADVLVAVQGQVQAGAQLLNATRVQCAGVSGSDSETVERSGVVTQVNLVTRTLTLLTSRGSVAIVWDAQTYFSMGFLQHPESLLGQSVEVEGVNQSGMLRARKIKTGGASHMPG